MIEKVIVDYKMAGGSSPANLTQAVKDAIDEGWQPIGGPMISHSSDTLILLWQAMVKYA